MIESYLLEHLVVFSEHRTLSETASVLHLTQPTLTRSMNKLEETFGVPLFTREKKRIRLNENGWMAARYAKEILREEEKMIAQVKALDRRRRTITVGSCDGNQAGEGTPCRPCRSHVPVRHPESPLGRCSALQRALRLRAPLRLPAALAQESIRHVHPLR